MIEKSFELLKMENKLKETSNYESVDCSVKNTVVNLKSKDNVSEFGASYEKTKINHSHQNECEQLIILADKEQEIEKPSNLKTNNSEIVSRYPELFEIFTETSKSEITTDNNNVPQQLIEKSKKEFTGSTLAKFPENHFDEEVRTIKEILLKQKVKSEKSPQVDKIENIVPEKLSSLQFSNNDASKNVKMRKSERPILLFNTQTKSCLATMENKNPTKEIKVPIKRKNSNDPVLDNNSNSKLKKHFDSNDNVTINLRNNKTISVNLEKNIQGDVNEVNVNEKKDKVKITEEKYEENRKKIFLNVIDTLIGVKAILFENRKLVESIQGYFQNCSIFHTIISDDAVTLLNEGISRCTMRIQCNERTKDLFVGANELLMESVRNLMKVVKEERDYLQQQEYYCKHFLRGTKNNRNTGLSKRNTKHTLIENDNLLSSSKKDRIEQLITYSVSLIKQIVAKKFLLKTENSKISPKRKGKIETEGKPPMENVPKAKNHLLHEIEDNSKNLKSGRNESKIIASTEKSNPIVSSLKLMNKDSNSEKLTRSSTIILPGNCTSSRQFSNSTRGRNNSNTQPIWKPAGNVNVTLPVRPISRQNTRLITSSFDKKREEKIDDVSLRNPISSRNDKKKFSAPHKIQRSSSSMGAYDLRKKSENSSTKIEQKSMSARVENNKSNNLIANPIESGESLNKNSSRAKWKTRQPEVIQMLKDLIKNNSEEENKISTNNSKNSLKLKKIDTSLLLNEKVENSQSKLSIKNKGDSKSGIAIMRNMSEDKIDDNSSKTKLNQRKYLRKNASDSSYLESYIKLNSRQNQVTNSRKSLSEKIKSKNSSQVEIKIKEEGKIDLEKTNNSKSLFNFQDNYQINSQSTCELGTKISSSKSCQVSFQTSSCSRNSDPVLDTETNSFESDNQCSETFIEKSNQFVDKSKKSFYHLKEILEKYGFNVDFVDNAERKSNLTENGSFSSILLDKESGAIVAVCSSQTIFDKLTTLSDSDLEIKKIINHFSLESIVNESQVTKIERKRNFEILQITDKMENNLRNSFSKHKNRSEEIFSINCVESCGKLEEEKKIKKTHSGIEEKFSFVNLILKEESERKINNFVNEKKKSDEKLLEIESKSLENCQKEENEEDGYIFDNLAKEEENCEEVNNPWEGERIVNTMNEKNEISSLSEEEESILIDINLNDKTDFSTNTNSNKFSPSNASERENFPPTEEKEFSPVNLSEEVNEKNKSVKSESFSTKNISPIEEKQLSPENFIEKTNEKNKSIKSENLSVNGKINFLSTEEKEFSPVNLSKKTNEKIKSVKSEILSLNRKNISPTEEKKLSPINSFEEKNEKHKTANLKSDNSVWNNKVENKNEEKLVVNEEKRFVAENLTQEKKIKISEELENFEEEQKTIKVESLNFNVNEENAKEQKINEVNSFPISKEIPKIEEFKNTTLNKEVENEEFSAVNLINEVDFSSVNLFPNEKVENQENISLVILKHSEEQVKPEINVHEDIKENNEDARKDFNSPIFSENSNSKKEFDKNVKTVSLVNLISSKESVKVVLSLEENFKEKIENLEQKLFLLNIQDEQNIELQFSNEINFQKESQKVSKKEMKKKKDITLGNLISTVECEKELLKNQNFQEKNEDYKREINSLVNSLLNQLENKEEISSLDSSSEKVINKKIPFGNLTSIDKFLNSKENSKKERKITKKLSASSSKIVKEENIENSKKKEKITEKSSSSSSKIVTNENIEEKPENSTKRIPQNEKSGKNLLLKKNGNKRLELNLKLRKKLSPIKNDDERFKKRLNSVLKAIATKSENILQETEKGKNKNHQTISNTSSLQNSNSCSKLKIPSKNTKKMETVTNFTISKEYSPKIEIIKNNSEFNENCNSPKKLISTINFIPSFTTFWRKEESNKKFEIKKKNLENSKNTEELKKNVTNETKLKEEINDDENQNKSTKKMENLFSNRKRRNNKKCKSCGKRRKYSSSSSLSSNKNCPLEKFESSSELLKTKRQKTIFLDDHSLPTVIKCKDSKIHKFTINDTPNLMAQNLAMTTLKLATKRVQNLYKNVIICRQCLQSAKNLENNYCPIEKNCLDLKNILFESKHDFSSLNISSGNAKTFRKTMKTFRNSSNQRDKYRGENGKIRKILFSEQFLKVLFIFVVIFLLIWCLY